MVLFKDDCQPGCVRVFIDTLESELETHHSLSFDISAKKDKYKISGIVYNRRSPNQTLTIGSAWNNKPEKFTTCALYDPNNNTLVQDTWLFITGEGSKNRDILFSEIIAKYNFFESAPLYDNWPRR